MRLIIAAAVLIAANITSVPTSVSAEPCSSGSQWIGGCNYGASTGPSEVVVGGSVTIPGSEGGSGGGGVGGAGGAGALAPGPGNPDCLGVVQVNGGERCFAVGPGKVRASEGVGAVTLSDIALFRPVSGVQFMEPAGWMIVGLDANFVANSGSQVVAGTLLGQSAEVRFSPVLWRWDYGDGDGRAATTGGGTWGALGVREFDPTPTSHVYTRAGTYTIRLSVDYVPEYRIGAGPWVGIAGVVSVPANDLVAIAGGAKTVLVDRDCTADPTGPGC